jgi:hypothetical protein
MSGPSLGNQIKVDGKFYTYLAEGAQSKVYRNQDEILKVPLTPDQIHENQKRFTHVYGADCSIQSATDAHHRWIELIRQFKDKIDSGSIPSDLFADLRIGADNLMFQKRVIIVEERFDPKSLTDTGAFKKLVDDFADIHLKLWRYGMCETECSLFSNYGIDPHTGKLVVPDFGSVSFSLDRARRSVGQHISVEEAVEFMARSDLTPEPHFPEWFGSGQVREFLRPYPELLAYYIDKMSTALTPDKLEILWAKS